MAQQQKFQLAKMTEKSQAYSNCVFLNPSDLARIGVSDGEKILIDEILLQRCRGDPNLTIGTIGSSNLQWSALHMDKNSAPGTNVTVQPWQTSKQNNSKVANTLSVVVDTYSKTKISVKQDELENYIARTFRNETFSTNSKYIISWNFQGNKVWLSLKIANIYIPKPGMSSSNGGGGNITRIKDMQAVRFGSLDENTVISLLSAQNPFMHLEVARGAQMAMSGPEWDAENLGIGGLDSQFSTIFRRAFASRLFPADTVKALGIKHVKGLLLFGPPGTGKTLIARSIGKMLTEREPKVVNGPEILNKYVGQSEENIRLLFADAEEDQKMNGDNAGLHIIIFDEIDAICKARGSTNTGTGVHDTVVNQLLSKIDGVNALNNIIVIGMTNRKDLLDQALLRAGRLEVHIEIGLPDEEGRQQIFRIHTRSIRENGFLDESISLSDLAARTKNYSGAEIEAVVRSAVSYAMQEFVDVESVGKIDPRRLKNIKITQEYFDMALEEIKAEYGQKEEEISLYSRGIYLFNDSIKEIIHLGNTVVNRMKRSNVMNRQAILLRGDLGTGKSALACYIGAEIANFPFLRIISSENYVGQSDLSICTSIAKIFNDAYKSTMSCIVLDDLERLVQLSPGPRFSNTILQCILVSIRRSPPSEDSRKILIIGTAGYDVCRTLNIDKVFDFVRDVPSVSSKKEFEQVIHEANYEKYCKPNVKSIVDCYPNDAKIGISNLLDVLEMANDNNVINETSFKYGWNSKFENNLDVADFDIDLNFETKEDV